MANSTAVLHAQALTVWRGERRLFADLEISAFAGRVLHIRGANGFGKTTLLRILAGLLSPETGSVHCDGMPLPGAQSRTAMMIGYLGHADGLKLDLSAMENLRFAAAISGGSQTHDHQAVLERLGLQAQAAITTRNLSAGQRRRLAIARLLCADHKIWILDEPFTALDQAGVEFLADTLQTALEHDVAIIMSSHQAIPVPAHYIDILELGQVERVAMSAEQ